jgi:outer membrane protein assembly factor BamB
MTLPSRSAAWPALFAVALSSIVLQGADWPRFRGPNGAGIATAPGLPAEWAPGDRTWETLLPGIGHSSPVVRGDRLFLTTASEDGTSRQLVCLATADGKILWDRSLSLKRDKLHAKNSHASGTPALAEDAVIVAFADDDRHLVAAFDFNGAPVWERDLGSFASQHGHGASPIVWRDLAIVPNDQDGPSSLVALDAQTGRTVWTAPRESGNTAYGTPLILQAEGHADQLIVSSQAMGVTSLDPASGMLNWNSGPLPQRTVASPVYAGGLIFQSCGQAGRGVLMVGVDPFAKSEDKRVVFEEKKLLPYVPTPVEYQGHLFLWNDNGVVICLNSKTRQPVWTERVGGNFSGSPVCVNGLLYAISEDGEVVVVRAAPKFELLGRTPLGDPSHATPAVADGRMYLRTFHKIVCLAPKQAG